MVNEKNLYRVSCSAQIEHQKKQTERCQEKNRTTLFHYLERNRVIREPMI